MDLIRAISFSFITIGSLLCLVGSPNLNASLPRASLSSPEHMNVSSSGHSESDPTPHAATPTPTPTPHSTPYTTPTPEITPVVWATPTPVSTVVPYCPPDSSRTCITRYSTDFSNNIFNSTTRTQEYTPNGVFQLPQNPSYDQPAPWCLAAARNAFARAEALCHNFIRNSLSDPALIALGVNSSNTVRFVGDCVGSMVMRATGIQIPSSERLGLAPNVVAYDFASRVSSNDGAPVFNLSAHAFFFPSYSYNKYYASGIAMTFTETGPCIPAGYREHQLGLAPYSRFPLASGYSHCPTNNVLAGCVRAGVSPWDLEIKPSS